MIVSIRTIDGREFTKQLDYPKGDPRNPLTDEEMEEKFAALAGPVMSREARRRAMDAMWNLEKQERDGVDEAVQGRTVKSAADGGRVTEMGQTIIEKIAQAHMAEGPKRPLRAGDFVSIRPKHVMTHDNTSAVMKKFKAIGARENP